MEAIIGDEKLTVKEYAGILDAGIADMEIGIVPPTIDRVVVGDKIGRASCRERVCLYV